MKEPHEKGVANRLGPESGVGDREVSGEAKDRGTRRPAMELRNHHFGVPTRSCQGEGYTDGGGEREPSSDAAESKTLSMRGNSMRENRERPELPTPMAAWDGRGRQNAERPTCTAPGSRTTS